MTGNRIRISSTVLTLLGLFASSTAFSLDKSYIEAVKLDLDEFYSGAFRPPEKSAWLPVGAKASADGAGSLASFSSFVKKRFPGTFILFQRLSQEQQTQVWQEYVKTGNLGGIRSNIYALKQSRGYRKDRPSITNLPRD